jgi:hypothetical protein
MVQDTLRTLQSILDYYQFEGVQDDLPELPRGLGVLAQEWGPTRLRACMRCLIIWINARVNGADPNSLPDLTWSVDLPALLQSMPELDGVFELCGTRMEYRAEVDPTERRRIDRVVEKGYHPRVFMSWRDKDGRRTGRPRSEIDSQ